MAAIRGEGAADVAGFPSALRRCRSCHQVVRLIWPPPGELLAARRRSAPG